MGNSFTTTTASASTDLTTLARVKRMLDISTSDDDTLLNELIDAISYRIEEFCGRTFAATDYYEWRNARGNEQIILREWPVINVDRVAIGNAIAMNVTYSGSGIRAQVSVNDTGVRLVSWSTTGTRTANTLSFADNASASAMKTAIDAVSGWSATVSVNVPSKELHRLAGEDADGRNVELTYPDDDDGDCRIDLDRGIIKFSNHWRVPSAVYGRGFAHGPARLSHGHQNVLIQYRAGYETIPADVQQVASEMVAVAYRLAKRGGDAALQSESLGDYSYSLADRVKMTEQMEKVLKLYRDVR